MFCFFSSIRNCNEVTTESNVCWIFTRVISISILPDSNFRVEFGAAKIPRNEDFRRSGRDKRGRQICRIKCQPSAPQRERREKLLSLMKAKLTLEYAPNFFSFGFSKLFLYSKNMKGRKTPRAICG